MRYNLIACFYEKADDKAPRYESPLGIYHETHIGDLEALGFKENPDSTPGYLDYIKEVVDTLTLLLLLEQGETDELHYKRILRSGNAAAVHVLEARLSQEVEYETRCRCWNRRKVFLTQLELLRSLMDNPPQEQK